MRYCKSTEDVCEPQPMPKEEEVLLWPKFYPGLSGAAVTAPTTQPLLPHQPPNTKASQSAPPPQVWGTRHTGSGIQGDGLTDWLTAALTDRLKPFWLCWTKTPKSKEYITRARLLKQVPPSVVNLCWCLKFTLKVTVLYYIIIKSECQPLSNGLAKFKVNIKH